MTLNWTKTETGYVVGLYFIKRTPGRRWILTFDGEPVHDGKQFSKLSDAKACAETHYEFTQEPVPVPDYDPDTDPDHIVLPPGSQPIPDDDEPVEPTPLEEPTPTPEPAPETVLVRQTNHDRDSLPNVMDRVLLYRDIGIRSYRIRYGTGQRNLRVAV